MSTAAATTGKQQSPVAQFSGFMDKLKPQIALALPSHMNADRMVRLVVTSFSTTPALQACSMNSIAGSLMTASQLGLEPGVNGQGYLVPYKTTCTFVPGWRGLVDLVARSGRATVWTGVVRPGDKFEYQLGGTPFCKHKPGDEDDDAVFTHVYAIGRVRYSEMPVIEVWSRAKVLKHLKKYNKVGGRHYAFADEHNFEMYARKTALLQVLKYMPSSIELANAIVASHAAEEGRGVTIENGIIIETGKSIIEEAAKLECCPDAHFEAKACDVLDHESGEIKVMGWESIVRSGKKSAADLIAMIETKYLFSDEQKSTILSWEGEAK
jgi:recombination protein RecT